MHLRKHSWLFNLPEVHPKCIYGNIRCQFHEICGFYHNIFELITYSFLIWQAYCRYSTTATVGWSGPTRITIHDMFVSARLQLKRHDDHTSGPLWWQMPVWISDPFQCPPYMDTHICMCTHIGTHAFFLYVTSCRNDIEQCRWFHCVRRDG